MSKSGADGHVDVGLLEDLRKLVDGRERDRSALGEGLAELASTHGDDVYRALFHRAAHLQLSGEEAREHWGTLAAHWEVLDTKIGSPQDLRVALVSYFLDVARRFEDPTVIEMEMLREARDLAYRDGLTGLFNFRYFRESMALEIGRSEQYGAPVSLVMIDVDDFKSFNDEHGHDAGNRALRDVASVLVESVRQVDAAVRYGGEEFALVLPSTPKVGARLTAERVRSRIESVFSERGAMTVSLGVATHPADAADSEGLVRCADRALYLAKATGKNRVALYQESSRSFQRVDAEIDGVFHVVAGPPQGLKTVNISESGLRVATDHEVPSGALIEVRLDLEGGQVRLPCQVVEVATGGTGVANLVNLKILQIEALERRRLRTLVRGLTTDAEPVE